MKPRLIAIAGASGSGKTTVALGLQKHYGDDQAIIISVDDFYNDQTHLSMDERKLTNYDRPQAIDFVLFHQVLSTLLNNQAVESPQYDFSVHNRKPQKKNVQPKPTIIIEGILALHSEELRKLFEIMIFVNTDSAICRERRIKRDVGPERKRTVEDATAQYDNVVAPMFLQHVLPTKEFAHICADNSEVNEELSFDVSEIAKEVEDIRRDRQTQQRLQSQMKLFGRKFERIAQVTAEQYRSPSLA